MSQVTKLPFPRRFFFVRCGPHFASIENKIFKCTIQMKAIEQYLPVVLSAVQSSSNV